MVTKILFVCSANFNRSPTAELWFKWLKPENNYYSAGTSKFACRKYGGKYINESVLENADRIICMETSNKKEIEKKYGDKFNKKMEVVGIKDEFSFLDIQLIFEIIDKIFI